MRILFVRWSALGDVVLTSGVMAIIRQHYPHATFDLASSKNFKDLFPESLKIRNFYAIEKGQSPGELKDLSHRLPDYDFVVDWQGNLKSKIFCKNLHGKILRIQKQSLTRRLYVKFRWGQNKLNSHVVQKYARTCFAEMDIPAYPTSSLGPQLKISKEAPAMALPENYVVVHPFASQKNKEWPYFLEFCKTLQEQNLNPVIIGSSPESHEFNGLDLVNQTSLQEITRVLANAKALVTTDSGPLHMAVGVGCPTLAVFGPTTKELGFYPEFKNTKVIEAQNLPCRPCHVHGGNSCPKSHFQCMKSLSSPQVLKDLKALLEKSGL